MKGSTPETAEKHEGGEFLFFYGKTDSNPAQKCDLFSLRMTPSLFRRGRRSSSPNQLIGALDLNREINIPPLQLIYTHSKVMNQIETCQKTQQPNTFLNNFRYQKYLANVTYTKRYHKFVVVPKTSGARNNIQRVSRERDRLGGSVNPSLPSLRYFPYNLKKKKNSRTRRGTKTRNNDEYLKKRAS